MGTAPHWAINCRTWVSSDGSAGGPPRPAGRVTAAGGSKEREQRESHGTTAAERHGRLLTIKQ